MLQHAVLSVNWVSPLLYTHLLTNRLTVLNHSKFVLESCL